MKKQLTFLFGLFVAIMVSAQTYNVNLDAILTGDIKPYKKGESVHISKVIHSIDTNDYGDVKDAYFLVIGKDTIPFSQRVNERLDLKYNDIQGLWDAEIIYNVFEELEKKAKELYPDCKVLFKWNTRDCITLDKIPYIGEFSNLMKNMYIGTGFKKWGMTFSNIAGEIVSDMILGKENKYQNTFDSTRMNPVKNRWEVKNIVKESVESIALNKLKIESHSINQIQNDNGGIIKMNDENVGIYKDKEGKIYAVKPVCTHLGCLLSWNNLDKTWDCPCHGSRFDYMGRNLYEPAIKDLKR